MDTLLVAAEEREFAGLLAVTRKNTSLPWNVEFAREVLVGNNERWVLVANGPGPKLAREAVETARGKRSFDRVVSTGFCGGLDPALKVGDVFVAESVERGSKFGYTPRGIGGEAARGRLLSIDRVIQSAEERQELFKLGWRVVEMEAAGVAEGAAEWGVPFYCVRVVSDAAGETFALDLNAARKSDGRFSVAKILWQAARRPGKAGPELWRLQRQTKRAARALAEFLTRCGFE